MFGVRYIKGDAMTYVIHYKKGQIKREGEGLSFFYYGPNSSIVMVDLGSNDVAFNILVPTMDYQGVTIEGNIVYRVERPRQLVQLLDFTVDHKGRYKKKGYEKLHLRLIHEAQTSALTFVQGLTVKGAMHSPRMMEEVILEGLRNSKMLGLLGVAVLGVSVFSIKPSSDVESALRTQALEALHQDTMQVIYDGKVFDVEQKRKVQESELTSEIALDEKKKEVAEMKMSADYAAQYHKRRMREMEIQSDILIEEHKKQLIELSTANNKAMAESNSYLIDAILMLLLQSQRNGLSTTDEDNSPAPPSHIVEALRELANNAARLGTLHISANLLKSILPQQAEHDEGDDYEADDDENES
ncbi:MAG: membrane protease subunit, stomatin/prohibitin [Nitrospirae bacterium]|nr:membrane protease subunit, stomatin/prohibitin [Nitrospirota bacterium]